MTIYLVRHAEAEPTPQDDQRPLTPEGAAAARAVGEKLKRMGVKVTAIWHSPKLRALQTAQAIAKMLKPGKGLAEQSFLDPLDKPGPAARALRDAADAGMAHIMVVGHLPHLARLAGKLLKWKRAVDRIDFSKPGVAIIERGKDGWVRSALLRDTNFHTDFYRRLMRPK